MGSTHDNLRRPWHDIIAFGQHTQSKYIGRGMPSPPLDSTHGRMTSGVPCHDRLWPAHTIERRQAWHAIIAFGKHKRSKDVARQHKWSNNITCCMTSSPLDYTYGRTTSGVECHHFPWTAHTVGNVGRGMTSPPFASIQGRQRRAWHDITALDKHTWSDDVGRGTTSPPFDYTHDRTT